MHRFSGSWDRVDRAVLHGQAYIEAANRLFQDNPPHLILDWKYDGVNGGSGVAKATFEKAFDNYLALELGEFFYQLRAALDGAFWEASGIVSSPNSPDLTRIEFPIYGSEERFKKSPIQKMAFPKDLHSFVESIQPYNVHKYLGTPEAEFLVALEVIHDCARFDRHRHLSLIAALPHKGTGRFTCNPPTSITFVRPLAPNFLEGDCDLIEFGIAGWDGTDDPEICLEGNLDIRIAVKELPVPLGGDPAEYLQMLKTTVAYIIKKFEEAFE